MKPLYLYVATGLVVAGFGATPLIVKYNIDKAFAEKKATLSSYGIALYETKNEGYLNNLREIELKISDGKKFRDFVLDEISKKEKNFALYADKIKVETNRDIHKVLDGITFKGEVENSNLMLNNLKVSLSLTALSDEFMAQMQKNEKLQKIFQPIFDEKLLTFYLDISPKEELKQLTFKDIDTTFYGEKNLQTKLNINNHYFSFNSNDARIRGLYNIDNQQIEVLDKNEILKYKVGKLQYKFDYMGQFDQIGSFDINDIELLSQRYKKNTSLHVKNFSISSKVVPSDKDTVSSSINYGVTGIDFQEGTSEFALGNSNVNLNIDNMHTHSLLTLSKAYQKIYFQHEKGEKEFIEAMTTFINSGLKANIKADIKGLSFKNISLADTSFTLDTTLSPNQFTIDKEFDTLLSSIASTGTLKVHKSDIQTLLSLNPSLEKILNLGKEEGEYFTYNTELKNGNFTINNQQF